MRLSMDDSRTEHAMAVDELAFWTFDTQREETLRQAAPAGRVPRALRVLPLATFLVAGYCALPVQTVGSDVAAAEAARLNGHEAVAPVWVAEDAGGLERYSNGLRISNRYATGNAQRFYQALDPARDFEALPQWYSEPAGIVFHTTEFVSDTLLASVRSRKAYNFVIDREGQVFRVVHELDAAHHAGNSVWEHGGRVWLNLNHSFLALAFEAETPAGAAPRLTELQLTAGKQLTQLLRYRYRIAPENCITHAQVSVNPLNMQIGFHTDGANGFPFGPIGLADNYGIPPASIVRFGFAYDDAFIQAAGGRMWRGITAAEHELDQQARAAGRTIEEERARLRQRYRRLYSSLKLTGAMDES